MPNVRDGAARPQAIDFVPGESKLLQHFFVVLTNIWCTQCRHFRNAGREELLGIRSIVDFWIARIDDAEDRAGSGAGRPERIDVG